MESGSHSGMSQGKPPRVLIASTLVIVVALVAWMVASPLGSESIAVDGWEWRVVGDKAVDHKTALRITPRGFSATGVDDIVSLASSSDFRGRFPQLFQPEAAIWSNRKKPFEETWYVVELGDTATAGQATHVWDFPAWVVVKKIAGNP